MSLILHPDKNKDEYAQEAFKLVDFLIYQLNKAN